MSRSRRSAFSLAAVPCCLGLGLALAGCGPSSHPAAAPASQTASAASTATASAAPTPTSATPTSAAPAAKPTCPSAAAITAAVGSAYPAPVVKTVSGTPTCTYVSASVVLAISFVTTTLPASELKLAVDSQALTKGITAVPVSGIGDAAYLLALKNAAAGTTTLIVQSGSRLVTIVGRVSAAQIEAVGRLAISP